MPNERIVSLTKNLLNSTLKDVPTNLCGSLKNEINHAFDVFNWVNFLTKNKSSPELQIAALLHDSERIINLKQSGAFQGNVDSQEYLVYKKKHALRSAQFARDKLSGQNISEESVEKICFLISHHDDTGEEIRLINNQELDTLVSADCFSFITSSAAKNMLQKYGRGRLEQKMKFMISKIPASFRKLLSNQLLDNPVIESIKENILNEFRPAIG